MVTKTGRTQALHQLLALREGKKTALNRVITNVYHKFQKTDTFNGRIRTYRPIEDGGVQLPSESQKVLDRASDLVTLAEDAWAQLIDITASVDATNATAKADVIVDGVTILTGVPATTLLWLEKQLVDMVTLWSKQSPLDPARDWSWDDTTLTWRSEPVETIRNDKKMENHVKAAATDKHPAQVEVFTVDRPAGVWTTVSLSGLHPVQTLTDVLRRLSKLLDAVKVAREEANRVDAVHMNLGAQIFAYLHP